MARIEAGFPWRIHGLTVLGAVTLLATTVPPATPLCAQRPAPMGRVEIVLEASAAMAPRPGGPGRLALARRFTLALKEELDDRGDGSPMGLRVYGSGGPDDQSGCRATRRPIDPGTVDADWGASLRDIVAAGPGPLTHALEQAAGDDVDTYVLLAAGGDGCGRDACRRWGEIAADRRDGRRARLHVVALDPTASGRDELLCLSRAGSGSFTTLRTPAEVDQAAQRLALVLRNEGLLDVRLSTGDEPFVAPLRVLRPLTGEVVAAFSTRGAHAVPAGMFDVAVETAPPLRLERVLLLPGETTVVERRDFGRLLVEVLGPGNEPLRLPFSIRRAGRREELRFATTGLPLILGSAEYEVRIEAGDSLLSRRVEVRTGSTARVTIGGTGTLVIEAPGVERPPADIAVAYGAGTTATLRVGEPATLPAGSYRLVVHTLPVYVTENVGVEARSTTRIQLPEVGVLGVELSSVSGVERGIPAKVYEPLTQEVYGTLLSGERRLIMSGTYRLDLSTVPPRDIGPVMVLPGEERIVSRDGLSRIELSVPASAPVRMEILDDRGNRLAEGRGRRPSVTVWPGSYTVRIWQGTRLLWEGRVTVASTKSARIDWVPSVPTQPTGESP
ncbi:MAG: hypothetical protein ACREMK_09420 [Gemmatimonadota bacterium]